MILNGRTTRGGLFHLAFLVLAIMGVFAVIISFLIKAGPPQAVGGVKEPEYTATVM